MPDPIPMKIIYGVILTFIGIFILGASFASAQSISFSVRGVGGSEMGWGLADFQIDQETGTVTAQLSELDTVLHTDGAVWYIVLEATSQSGQKFYSNFVQIHDYSASSPATINLPSGYYTQFGVWAVITFEYPNGEVAACEDWKECASMPYIWNSGNGPLYVYGAGTSPLTLYDSTVQDQDELVVVNNASPDLYTGTYFFADTEAPEEDFSVCRIDVIAHGTGSARFFAEFGLPGHSGYATSSPQIINYATPTLISFDFPSCALMAPGTNNVFKLATTSTADTFFSSTFTTTTQSSQAGYPGGFIHYNNGTGNFTNLEIRVVFSQVPGVNPLEDALTLDELDDFWPYYATSTYYGDLAEERGLCESFATSTGMFGTSFSVGAFVDCISDIAKFLVVPGSSGFSDDANSAYERLKHRQPIGYFFVLIELLNQVFEPTFISENIEADLTIPWYSPSGSMGELTLITVAQLECPESGTECGTMQDSYRTFRETTRQWSYWLFYFLFLCYLGNRAYELINDL